MTGININEEMMEKSDTVIMPMDMANQLLNYYTDYVNTQSREVSISNSGPMEDKFRTEMFEREAERIKMLVEFRKLMGK